MSAPDQAESGKLRPMLSWRRIVLLFDASPGSLAALDLAHSLARQVGLDLEVVYLDDAEQRRLTAFSHFGEVGGLTGRLHKAEPRTQAGGLRLRLEYMRQLLQRQLSGSGAAPAAGVQRIEDVETLFELLQADDLLVLGRVGSSIYRGRRLGSRALLLARRAPSWVLLSAGRASNGARAVVALVETGTDQAGLVEVAALRAAQGGKPLYLLPADVGVDDIANIMAGLPAARLLPRLGQEAVASRLAALAKLLARLDTAELVLSRSGQLLQALGQEGGIAELDLSLVVMP